MSNQAIKNIAVEPTPSVDSIMLLLKTSVHKGFDPLQVTRAQLTHSPVATMLFNMEPRLAAVTIASGANGLDTITLARDPGVSFATATEAAQFWFKLVKQIDDYVQRFVNLNTLEKMPLLFPKQIQQMKKRSLADWEIDFRAQGDDAATARRKALLSIVSSTTVSLHGGSLTYKDFSKKTGTMLIDMAFGCSTCKSTQQTLFGNGNPNDPNTLQGFMRENTADLGSLQVKHVLQDGFRVVKMEMLPVTTFSLAQTFAARSMNTEQFVRTVMTDQRFAQRTPVNKLPVNPQCKREAMGMESDLYLHNIFAEDRYRRAVIISNEPRTRDSMPQGWLPIPKIFVGEEAAVALTYARPGCDNGLLLIFGAKAAGNKTGLVVELQSSDVSKPMFDATDVITVPSQSVVHLHKHLSDPQHACDVSLKTGAATGSRALTM